MRTTGLLLALIAMVALVSSAQARPSATSSAAADVRDLGDSIEQIHPAPFRSISRGRFEAEVNDLAARAPRISRDELLVGVLRIIGSLGPRNGHTGLFPGDPGNVRPLHLYPIRLYRFADGVFVVDADDRSLVGRRLVAVEGTPTERVFELVEPLVPHDNAWNTRGMAPHYVLTAEVLHGLGIVDTAGAADFTLEGSGGERTDVTLTPIPGPQYASEFADPLHGHYPSVLPSAPRPLYLANNGKPLWVTTLAGQRAVYVGFNAVSAPAPAVLRRIRRLALAPRTRRVIVDLRLNGGGDNTTYGPLVDLFASKQVNRRGKLVLLIGRATFSAAANFAAEIDRDTRAVFVGEPTGGGVETYGDTVPVLLPSLGWYVYVASRYHERKRGPMDHRLAVAPDVRVELTSALYFAGQDPVLERVLKGL
jgi:peptidase S41-like protein